MKVVNSGYGLKQTREIIVGGLKGYERKLKLSLDLDNPRWKPLHQEDDYNISGRNKKKILAKTSWFKRKRDDEDDGEGRQSKSSRQEHQPRGTGNQKDVSNPNIKPETVPEGWRRDEPEEESRARTTGGTHHHTSQEVKEGKVQTAGIGRFKQMKN